MLARRIVETLLVLLAVASGAHAAPAECATVRESLSQAQARALRLPTKAQCTELRRIAKESAARPDCAAELQLLMTVVESKVLIACSCPPDPAAEISGCSKVAAGISSCGAEEERALLQCHSRLELLARCDVPEPRRAPAEKAVGDAYARCPTCMDAGKKLGTASAGVAAAKTCGAVGRERQVWNAVRLCPQASSTELRALASALTAAEEKLCPKSDTLVGKLRGQIELINEEIKKYKDCASEPDCSKLESQRLLALTAYLEHVRVLAPKEQERARSLLRGVGTDPSIVELIARHGAGHIKSALAVFDLYNSPERERFLGALESSNMDELAGRLRANGQTFEEFLAAFLASDPDVQERALGVSEGFRSSADEFQKLQEVHRGRGRWEVWLDEDDDQCETCSVFTSTFLRYIKGTPLEKVENQQEFDARLRARHAECRAERASPTAKIDPRALPCGLILRASLSVRERQIEARGTLYFPTGGASIESMQTRIVELPPFERGRGERPAAREFARLALMQVSTFFGSGDTPPPPPGPSTYCGVRVAFDPDFDPAPLRRGLDVQGDCGQPSLVEGLKRSLSESGLVGTLGPLQPGTPRLVLDPGDSGAGLRVCQAQLFAGEKEARYAVRVVVDTTAKCGDESANVRWKHAGAALGDQVARYYAQPANVHVEPAGSSGWYALTFAGAPYLADPRAESWSKVVPSIVDGALMIGSAVAFGLSVKYRNDLARGRKSSTAYSQRAVNTGIAFATVLLAFRIGSGLEYAYGDAWRKSEREEEP